MSNLCENLYEIYTHLLFFGVGVMVTILWIYKRKIVMSKIDVNKCDYSDIGECFDNNFYKFCNLFDEPCADVRNKDRCFYQLKHKLQQLESDNEELKSKLDMQESIGYPLCFTCIVEDCKCNKSKLYEECVNEIEKICEMKISDYPMNKIVEITQLIRKVRETINE